MTKSSDNMHLSYNHETGFYQIEGLKLVTPEEERESIKNMDPMRTFFVSMEAEAHALELQKKYIEEDKLKEKNRKDA